MKTKFPKKSANLNLPSREINTNTNIERIVTAQFAMLVRFLGIANFLVIVFVKSERAVLDIYNLVGNIRRCQNI